MDEYKVFLYPQACRDIEEIYMYLTFQKLAPEAAKGQTDRISEAIRSLAVFPYTHQDRLEGKYALKGYKQLLIDNYLAIYKIDEIEKTVKVITVQYQGKDL